MKRQMSTGATYIQKVWNITLPAIKPTIIIMTLLAIGQIFRGDFGCFTNWLEVTPPYWR